MIRRRAGIRRSSAVVKQAPWSDSFKTVFRLAGDDWTPPETVTVRYGARSWTLTAVFAFDAQRAELKTRVTLGADGRPASVASETMRFVFRLRGGK